MLSHNLEFSLPFSDSARKTVQKMASRAPGPQFSYSSYFSNFSRKRFLSQKRGLIATDRTETLSKCSRAPGAPFGPGFDRENGQKIGFKKIKKLFKCSVSLSAPNQRPRLRHGGGGAPLRGAAAAVREGWGAACPPRGRCNTPLTPAAPAWDPPVGNDGGR